MISLILFKLFYDSKFESQFIVFMIPVIIYLIVKAYSWIVVVSEFRLRNDEEKKRQFASQWIHNTILASPNIRLTLPVPYISQSCEHLMTETA